MTWAEYAEASRRLAEIRQLGARRQAETEQSVSAGRSAVTQLRQRIAAQQEHLAGLAVRLQEPRPSFDDVSRAGVTDIDDALRRSQEAIESADADARRAEERARQPALLPGMSTTGRNALVYLTATFVASLVSCGLWQGSSDTDLGRIPLSLVPWSLCGLPALAFFGGYVTIALFGRSRLASGRGADYSLRLGGLICFGVMTALWLLLVVSTG